MEFIAQNFNLQDYFNRINYNGTQDAKLETLKAIFERQVQTLPFENADIWKFGKIVSLKLEDIVQKIVYSKRGGYCYELNGLLAMALASLGYEFYFAAARPMIYAEKRPKTHLVIIVTIDNQKYLCDSGFGGYTMREPILIEDWIVATQQADTYKLSKVDNEYILSHKLDDEFRSQYSFGLVPQEWIEFNLANYFNSTHKDAIFTNKKLAIIQTANGRKFLIDNELKEYEGLTHITSFIDNDIYLQKLNDLFGVNF